MVPAGAGAPEGGATAMQALKAVILGIVQGLTEFLPISSSGHLVLLQNLFGLTEPELLFDVVLHCGTLLAIVIVFRQEVLSLVYEFFRLPKSLWGHGTAGRSWRYRPHFRMLVLIIVGSVPTAIIGLGFKDVFESLFGSTLAVGIALLVTGLVLFCTRWVGARGRGIDGFRARDALVVGLAQGLAITPGISRSGFTISAGLFLGLDRELAARYSFLMSIPAILGALVLELREARAGAFGAIDLGLGFFAALVAGVFALIVLMKLVEQGRLHWFAGYCWLVGSIVIVLSLRG
jgi:undecaprenyl-diphosphatase